LKHVEGYKKILRKLRAKGLIFSHKAGKAVGITELGDEVLAETSE
jgi:predicted transcriptional regulator